MSCIYIFKCIGSSLSYGCSVNFNIADFISIICCDRECSTFTFCNRYLAICKTFCCDRTAFTCCCCDIIRLNCNVLWCNFKFIKLRCTAVVYRLKDQRSFSCFCYNNIKLNCTNRKHIIYFCMWSCYISGYNLIVCF